MIVHKLLPDGGFVCGDTETRRTSYAYPTSTHAIMAKRRPNRAAWAMLREANDFPAPVGIQATYDARQWAKLEGAE